MPYSQRFVVSVLVEGSVQKERPDGSVEIPFGVEYALRFRNKHRDRRAVVELFIDGEKQSKGGYVIPPNSAKDIERNSFSPKKFRFVAPDSTAAQEFGKDQNNDAGYNGVIEARFYLEKEPPREIHHHHYHQDSVRYPYPPIQRPPHWLNKSTDSMDCTIECGVPSAVGNNSFGLCPPTTNPTNDCSHGHFSNHNERRRNTIAGVTVEGSHSNQTFRAIDIELEEDFVPIKVLLRGYVAAEFEGSASGDNEVAEVISKKK